MNNLMIGLKRFFTNKNVVTVILVIVALGILFWGYTTTIKKETNPVSVPVAKTKINQRTIITQEDVTFKTVAASMVSENVIKLSKDIVGKYTNLNVTIPAGSMFYSEWLIEGEKLPGNWIEELDIKKGEIGYYMSTNVVATLGNNVLPGSYIDIYMAAEDENGVLMYGRLLENIKILVVHDTSGKNVFDDAQSIGTPSRLGFAVSQDLYMLLYKAEALGIDLNIVPRGVTPPEKEGVLVKSSTLRDYIDAQAITVEEDIIADEEQSETQEEGSLEQPIEQQPQNQ